MDYNAYGRSSRGSGGYFENDSIPSESRHYPVERDNLSTSHKWNHAQQRYSPPILNNDRMPPVAEPSARENVSPEVIAAITERVKREVMEHLKATGSIDEVTKAPPMQRQHSNKSNSTSSPPPANRRVYTPPSPAQPAPKAYTEASKSPPASPLDKPSVRFSEREKTQARPSMPGGRSYSTAELSTVDQKWGRLFDSDGRPTQRLGQFLRGLANHIIEDLPPKKSIVIPPAKMAAFYAAHGLEVEPHPLLSIFRAQSNENISQLYQDLGCQHHLVQEQSSQPCLIPSLTPLGFAHWMTIQILSYPEEEWRRLEKVVLAMPINADGEMIDGKPERLPKQISRYLLPDVEDRATRKLLDKAIKDYLEDLGSAPRRKKSITSPPPLNRKSSTSQRRNSSSHRQNRPPVEIHQEKKSPTLPKPNPLERERKPYAGAPGSDVSSNEDGIKIERERQPYTAQPGNGRVYDNLNLPNRDKRSNSTSKPKEPEFAEQRHHRTHSDARRDTYMGPPPARSSTRRTSSPPLKSFSNSTPIDINNSSNTSYGPMPSTSTASFIPPPTFSPRSFASSASSFPPPPPPMDSRGGERREAYTGRRIPDDEPVSSRIAGEFNSPRDAERWDRYQDARAAADAFGIPYERGSVSIDPRDTSVPLSRGAPTEEWYREKPRGSGYDDFRRYA